MSGTQLYIIGTLHSGYTPEQELREMLENINPEFIFLELPPQDIAKSKRADDPRQEMFFAYHWAQEQGITVEFFDTPEGDSFNEGYSEESPEYKQLLAETEEKLKHYSWKDLNRTKNINKFKHPFEETLIDMNKREQRQEQMVKNIKHAMPNSAKVVVLTGPFHLKYLAMKFPEARFPLGDQLTPDI